MYIDWFQCILGRSGSRAFVKVASDCRDAEAIVEGLPWLLCPDQGLLGSCLTFGEEPGIVRCICRSTMV